MGSSGPDGRAKSRARRKAEGVCVDCGGERAPRSVTRCEGCLERYAEKNAVRRERLKVAAFAAYGNRCACCGDNPKFLTIDHIDGGGHRHRRQIGGPAMVLEWLARHGYPEGFRLLCWNCNCARAFNGGVCPHEEQRGEVRQLHAV